MVENRITPVNCEGWEIQNWVAPGGWSNCYMKADGSLRVFTTEGECQQVFDHMFKRYGVEYRMYQNIVPPIEKEKTWTDKLSDTFGLG